MINVPKNSDLDQMPQKVSTLFGITYIWFEPAFEKTYNKNCNDQQKPRSACTSSQYIKGSRLTLFE